MADAIHEDLVAPSNKVQQQMEATAKAAAGSSDEEELEGVCRLCTRAMPLTRHHLIPRAAHKAKLKKQVPRDKLNATVLICRPCHTAIHRMISLEDMATRYNTLEALLNLEGVQKWVKWAGKQKVVSKDFAKMRLRYSR